jgi:hypothetical protein
VATREDEGMRLGDVWSEQEEKETDNKQRSERRPKLWNLGRAREEAANG